MPTITDIPTIAFSDLMVLRHTTGILEIDIKQVNGYFLPFVLFTKPGQDQAMHGLVMNGNNALACLDLNELVDELRATLGFDVALHVPKTPETTLH